MGYRGLSVSSIKIIASLIFCYCLSTVTKGQQLTSSSIFSHNDYVQPVPFYNAIAHEVGYIEADVFLEKKELFVSHTKEEIVSSKSLEKLYLKPLQEHIIANKGFAYASQKKKLTLMIDLKTEGTSTLKALVKKLASYPELIKCPTLQITISGNVPAPAEWKDFPNYIYFDGRPGIAYTAEQLARISLISTSFGGYSKWNGKGVLPNSEKEKILSLIDEVHSKGKKIRFWAAPDITNAWLNYIEWGIDVINTDYVSDLADFVKKLPDNTFQNHHTYETYNTEHSKHQLGKTPRNVILMIGDGMGLAQLYSGYTANHRALNIFNILNIGFSITTSSDSYITDSAAGGTAMSSGKKTKNRHVGVDSAGNRLPLITDKLKKSDFKTAIISSGDITDATPASFYAHQPERSMSEDIASDFLQTDNDILIGGGLKSFNSRSDKRNLFGELKVKGYAISESYRSIDTLQGERFIIIDDSASLSVSKGRGDFLERSLKGTLAVLSKNSVPFFIMEEGAQIDWGGHSNNLEYVVREMLDFDKAVGEAMKFVDENKETLLIVTADHETGGLSLLGGNFNKGSVYGNFSSSDHSAIMVPVFSYGPGSEMFRGVYQNTELHWKILQALKIADASMVGVEK